MLKGWLFLVVSLALVGCSAGVGDPVVELAQFGGKVPEYRLKLERDVLQHPEDPKAAYKLAWLLHREGESQAAWGPAQTSINLSPLSAPNRLLAGLIQQDLGDHFQAVNLLSSAIKLDDQLLEAYLQLAKSLEITGRYDEAVTQLEMALQIEPLYFEARLARVKVKLLVGAEEASAELQIGAQDGNSELLEELADEMEQALKIRPGSEEGTLLLAELYENLGAGLKAQLRMEDWLKQYGDHDKTLLALAQLYLSQNQTKQAQQAISRLKNRGAAAAALHIQLRQASQPPLLRLSEIKSQLIAFPGSLQLHLLEGKTLVELGRLDQAERKLQRVLTIEPKSVDAFLLLAQVYAGQSDFVAEEQALNSAVQLAPQSLSVTLAFAESLIRKGLYGQAAAQISGRPKLDKDRRLLLLRSKLALKNRDFVSGARWLKGAEKQGIDGASQLVRATLEIGKGNVERGIKSLKTLLSREPANLEAKLALAQGYLKSDQSAAAVALLRPVLSSKLGRGQVHFIVARGLLNQGQTGQSQAVLADGLRLWPRDPDLVQLYTAELGFVGKWNQAIPYLEEMMLFSHQYNQLFSYRLWEFYKKSGNQKKFRLYRLPGEL